MVARNAIRSCTECWLAPVPIIDWYPYGSSCVGGEKGGKTTLADDRMHMIPISSLWTPNPPNPSR